MPTGQANGGAAAEPDADALAGAGGGKVIGSWRNLYAPTTTATDTTSPMTVPITRPRFDG
jgi:hypothetical protein